MSDRKESNPKRKANVVRVVDLKRLMEEAPGGRVTPSDQAHIRRQSTRGGPVVEIKSN